MTENRGSLDEIGVSIESIKLGDDKRANEMIENFQYEKIRNKNTSGAMMKIK